MEMMKKTILMAAGLLLGLLPCAVFAQTVTYSLPSTTVSLEVTAVREAFYAGPYAAYAAKYLGINAERENTVRTVLESVVMEPLAEADLAKRYTVAPGAAADRLLTLGSMGLVSFGSATPSESVAWRFPAAAASPDFSSAAVTAPFETQTRTIYKNVQTDTAVVRVAEQQTVQVEKSIEARAKEAADMILKARREKFNITIGNTDATFSGEALGAAIDELTRVENEYMKLFTTASKFSSDSVSKSFLI